MIIYTSFAFIYLILGFYFIKNRQNAFKYFIILTVLLPMGTVFKVYFVKYNVGVFEYFYFGVMIYFFIYLTIKHIAPKPLLILLYGIVLLIILNLLSSEDIKYILKDLKPFFVLMVAIVLLYILSKENVNYNSKILHILLFLNFIKYISIYILGHHFDLINTISDDAYYVIHTTFRYSDLGLAFIAYYCIYKTVNNKKFNLYDIFYIAIPVLISQSRTLLVLLIIIMLINSLLYKKIIFKLYYMILAPIVLFGIIYLMGERFLVLLDLKVIIKILVARFSPFIIELNNFGFYDYFIGKGIGHPFYIPWFDYRGNIDNFNPNIDNLYLTYYMKFGVFIVFIFYGIYYTLKHFVKHRRYANFLFIYFLLISLTTGFTYQTAFIFLYLYPFFILCSYNINKGVIK